MLLLEAYDVTKYYAERQILHVDCLTIYTGDRIGLIGLNGSGKTTLLRILRGELAPDSGYVRSYCDIAYVSQFDGDTPVEASADKLSRYGVSGKTQDGNISGGENTRIKIAAALSGFAPVLLFADEPTSNLDFAGVQLFCDELRRIDSYVIVSHDRNILSKHCNKIIEISNSELKVYEGGYEFYVKQSEKDKQRHWFEYQQYADERHRLQNALAERQSKSKSMRKTPKRMGNSEARLHRRSATEKEEKVNSARKSIETRLNKLEVVQKPREAEAIAIDFCLTNPPSNKIVLRAENFSYAYGSNVIFDNAAFDIINGSKVAIYAANGAGKTTLLNAVANMSDGIYAVPKANIGYFYQGFENLDFGKTVLQNVLTDSVQSESTARSVLARLLIRRDEVHKKAGALSGGERIKLAFAKLILSRANVLMLDEPTNYLDMKSIEVLQSIIAEYAGTVLFVSHDRAFVDAVADTLLLIQDKKINVFSGNIQSYESHQNKIATQDDDIQLRITMLRLQQQQILRQMKMSAEEERLLLEQQYNSIAEQLREICAD